VADFSLLTVVHVANVLARESGGRSDGIPLPRLDAPYLATLELPKKTDAWRKLLDSPPPTPVPVQQEDVEERPAPLPMEQEVKPPSIGKLFLWLGLAVVVVAAVMLWKNFNFSALLPKATPGTNSVPALVATSPSPAVAAGGEKPPPAQGASPFDEIKVQAIIYNPSHPVVLINGKSLNVGDHINGLEVISIERSKVVLSGNGEQKTFALK
jgi:hypothetical protein